MKNLNQKSSGIYEARVRIRTTDPITYKSLGTRNKEVAQKRLNDLYRQMEREAEGLATPTKLKQAAQTTLKKHLRAYISDLETTCSSSKHTQVCHDRIKLLMRECNWRKLADIDSSSFIAWRAGQKKQPKTLNDYQSALNSFLVWLKENELLEANPIERVKKVPVRGRHKFHRRPLTHQEAANLLNVAEERRSVYVTALYTGLRRNEIESLQWGDIHLEADTPYLVARASTTKNGKQAMIKLHQEVVESLCSIWPMASNIAEPVFDVPTIEQFKKDLKAAEIEYLDAQGGRADFHSLRHTFATWNALAGNSPQITKSLMRHSDIKLTMNVYTDVSQLPTSAAIDQLPSIKTPQIAPQKAGSEGHFESQADTEGKIIQFVKPTDSRGSSHNLARTGTEGEWCSRWESNPSCGGSMFVFTRKNEHNEYKNYSVRTRFVQIEWSLHQAYMPRGNEGGNGF